MSATSDAAPTVDVWSREALSILEANITDAASAIDSALLQLQRHTERLISLESESDYLRLQIEHCSASFSMLFMPQDVARQLFIRPLINLPEDFTQGLVEARTILSDINGLTVERRRLRNETVKLFSRTFAELTAANDRPPQPARNGIIQQHFARLWDIRQVLTTQHEQMEHLRKKLVVQIGSLIAAPEFLPDQAGSPINVVDLRTALQAFIDLCRGARAHSRFLRVASVRDSGLALSNETK
ncbi:uncharacterized protein B0H18DRAFT_959988 [Fomitopsis serialis]|uniref:uncharacterized protein n=1 Tax=Fomitopsis serialis TaxID=139415 RepID=UPI00200786CA|nr:uncharacterized protein B0H18DRAFT_959988 [Neoantrodia serialis]KAH9914206.1 hypothetical protein B0H18DRAFT_959988 [Neoantrodia serialis]